MAEEKRGRGRPVKPADVTPDELAAAAAEIAANGGSRYDLAEATGVSERAAEYLIKAAKLSYADFQERFRQKAQSIVDRAADRLAEKIDDPKLSATNLAITIGVMADKLKDTQPRNGPQSVHLHLHGADREGALGMVLGQAKQRISTHPATAANPTAPVLDAELVPAPAHPGHDLQSGDSQSPRKQ